MHVISIRKLRNFWAVHPDAGPALRAWNKTVEHAEWRRPQDVRDTYRQADPIGGEFVVFDIGRQYRLVVCVDYKQLKVFIWDVLTHSDYDAFDFKAIVAEKKRQSDGRRPH